MSKVKKMLDNPNVSFDEFYTFLREKDLGDWDSVNSEEIIKEYLNKMMTEGVHVSHILEALESHPSREGLYSIWLGNSMETPEPINTKKQLYDALFWGMKDEK